MPRPRRCRRVWGEPHFSMFKPSGVPSHMLEEVILTVGEYEAIRLKDLENLEQAKAAEKMGISQPTFHRLLSSARRKISEAIVNGKSIKIHGGSYEVQKKKII